MALTSNTWNFITIAGLTTPPWTTSAYAANAFIIDAIIAATPVLVFCVFDVGGAGSALIAHPGGTAFIPSAAITPSSVPAMDVTTMDDGDVWYSVRSGSGSWLYYSQNAGAVRSLSSPTALGTFIS